MITSTGKLKKEILVTGSSGYIGSHIVERLSQMLDVSVVTFPKHFDITDAAEVNNFFLGSNITHVVHCAALVSTRLCDVAKQWAYKVNVEGTQNIIDGADLVGAKMLYIGTTASYQLGHTWISETTPIEPNTLYGLTKYLGEQLVERQCARFHILRFCFCFGRNDAVSAISQMIRAYRTDRPVILELDPNNEKDYMHVSDFCEAVALLIEHGKFNGEIYNVSHQTPVKFGAVVEMLRSKGITPIVYFRPEADYLGHHRVLSTKFRKEFGWKPKKTLEDGIDECLKYEQEGQSEEKSSSGNKNSKEV